MLDFRLKTEVSFIRMKNSEIDLLINNLGTEDNPLHIDYSISVYKLIHIGMPAVPKLLEAYVSGCDLTRLRASTALGGILACRLGFEFGAGWKGCKDQDGDEKFREVYKCLGDLNPNNAIKTRRETAESWLVWWKSEQN